MNTEITIFLSALTGGLAMTGLCIRMRWTLKERTAEVLDHTSRRLEFVAENIGKFRHHHWKRRYCEGRRARLLGVLRRVNQRLQARSTRGVD